MKGLNKIMVLIGLVLLASCNFTENLEINDDGSGTFFVDIDGSGLMGLAGDKMGPSIGNFSNKTIIDSTFSFKQLLSQKKDSISKLPLQKQEALKKIENFVMRLKMNSIEKKFLFTINTPFQNVAELESIMVGLKELKNIKTKSEHDQLAIPLGHDFGDNHSKLNFSYSGSSFSRTAQVLSKNKYYKPEADTLGMLSMIFAGSSYTLKYHFPKRVKTVSNSNATFSSDKKTVIVDYPFIDYMENPDKLNLKVEFE